jgi:hypothetical protein
MAYAASLIIAAWGAAHIWPWKKVVKGFGPVSYENRLIITMEWIAEGMTLVFIGAACASVTYVFGADSPAAGLMYRLSAFMLFSLAALSLFTGARVKLLAMRTCPAVKAACAVMLLLS